MTTHVTDWVWESKCKSLEGYRFRYPLGTINCVCVLGHWYITRQSVKLFSSWKVYESNATNATAWIDTLGLAFWDYWVGTMFPIGVGAYVPREIVIEKFRIPSVIHL